MGADLRGLGRDRSQPAQAAAARRPLKATVPAKTRRHGAAAPHATRLDERFRSLAASP
ncbi:hypothetical protein ACWD4B_22970 [Streptomyces sp. NPDC002536]